MADSTIKATKKETIDALLMGISYLEPKAIAMFVRQAITKLNNNDLNILFNACAKEGDWCIEDLFTLNEANSLEVVEDKKKKK